MELFEDLRRDYEGGVGTIQGVARKFGVHRRMVREAVDGAVPIERLPTARWRPRVGPITAFVDAILEADRRAPRKQRRTALTCDCGRNCQVIRSRSRRFAITCGSGERRWVSRALKAWLRTFFLVDITRYIKT